MVEWRSEDFEAAEWVRLSLPPACCKSKFYSWLFWLILDNTAGILTRRSSFSRQDRTQYLLPVVITDSGVPPLSSTATLTITVCGCQPAGHCPSDGVQALALPMGLSIYVLVATVVCILTVTGEGVQGTCVIFLNNIGGGGGLSSQFIPFEFWRRFTWKTILQYWIISYKP